MGNQVGTAWGWSLGAPQFQVAFPTQRLPLPTQQMPEFKIECLQARRQVHCFLGPITVLAAGSPGNRSLSDPDQPMYAI